ncbi:hypothetical protein CaCOL14_012765 [Colletotrichum acutatum]
MHTRRTELCLILDQSNSFTLERRARIKAWDRLCAADAGHDFRPRPCSYKVKDFIVKTIPNTSFTENHIEITIWDVREFACGARMRSSRESQKVGDCPVVPIRKAGRING